MYNYCRFDQEVNTFIQVNEYGHLVELNNSKKGKLVIINKSSLRASSPVWASETGLARTCERAAKP